LVSCEYWNILDLEYIGIIDDILFEYIGIIDVDVSAMA
jgi:hypothetical protein